MTGNPYFTNWLSPCSRHLGNDLHWAAVRASGNATIRRMAGQAKESKALIIIRKTWIDEAGMSDILEPENPPPLPSAVKFQAVRATEISLVDSWFLEFEFYPKFLNGEQTAKLLVPKQEVLAVLQTDNPEHLVGFNLARKSSE